VAGELNQDQREIAQILRHNTGVLQGQIEDLLRLNTAAFEARQLHRQSTDLRELVESQVDAQRLQWRARELTIEIIGERVLVALDPEKIGVVLANLLSNAIRYSPLQSTIRLELSTLPGLVCVDIQDQGTGIAIVDRERIFEPFYRGERQPTDVVRGSGIGLSIVHEYVAAHGGRIELLADPAGAHFRMELPHVFTS
jgi:two-component system sensor histidine kinase GlrK